MRILSAIFFIVVLFNFSGVPELLMGILDKNAAYELAMENTDCKQKEDAKEKEEKGKEELKDTVLAESFFLSGLTPVIVFETTHRLLPESCFCPDNQSPPPEFV